MTNASDNKVCAPENYKTWKKEHVSINNMIGHKNCQSEPKNMSLVNR